MNEKLLLLPYPQKLERLEGVFQLPALGRISISGPQVDRLRYPARRLQQALRDHLGFEYSIAAGEAVPATIRLRDGGDGMVGQGYTLLIDNSGVTVNGQDAAGAFYGALTLIQIIEQRAGTLPSLRIEDYPDLPARGVMLDISRDKVPTMETLYALIDQLAAWKINQFQLYTEHTFAYQQHPKVWAKASPITAEEILDLDAYCRERFIELVPNQNSFGHMHRWFEHSPYDQLAEVDAPTLSPWGDMLPPFTLAPVDPGSIELVKSLFVELLPNFSSDKLNVGCDETFDLGRGRSKDYVEELGMGRAYLEFLLKIYDLVKQHGRTMQFWGDIIVEHPELVSQVPKDVIALEWGYEDTHNYPDNTRIFAQSGVPFYVCPGTSSWTTIGGRTENCIGNIRSAVENGRKNGAIGMLNTDWGDWGHWQTLPVSYTGFAYGAAVSWAYDANHDMDVAALLDTFCFYDEAGVTGKVLIDLGDAYKQVGAQIPNGSLLFWFYHFPLEAMRKRLAERGAKAGGDILEDDARLTEHLKQTISYIKEAIAPLDKARIQRDDAPLIHRELRHAARMMIHGAQTALSQLGASDWTKADLRDDLAAIEAEHRALWMQRNRPGGLDDSSARFETARTRYKES